MVRILPQKLIEYTKSHKIMTGFIIISVIISVAVFILSLWAVVPWKFFSWMTFLAFIPSAIFISFVFLFSKLKKHPRWYGFLSTMLVLSIILVQPIYYLIFLLSYAEIYKDIPYNNYRNYSKIVKLKKDDYNFNKIFPNKIPENAKNVVLIGRTSPSFAVFAYERIALSFNITPDYIQEVKKSYSNIKPIHDSKTKSNHYISQLPTQLMDKNSDMYQIVSESKYPDENHENTFSGGIIINEKTNKIIYYYQTFYGDYCGGCYSSYIGSSEKRLKKIEENEKSEKQLVEPLKIKNHNIEKKETFPNSDIYMNEVQKKINKNWKPPIFAHSTQTKIHFEIDRDGKIISAKISQSSNNKKLDKSALDAVYSAAPFQPFPANWKEKSVTIDFSFDT